MTIKSEAVYLSLLAALGLACGDRTPTTEGGSQSSGSSDSASSDTDAESGSSSAGDGDGDTTTMATMTTDTTASGDGDGDTTTNGDGDGDTTTGDGDGEPPEPFTCDDPVVIMQAGTDTPSGFVECNNGFIHREEAVACLAPQGMDEPSCGEIMAGCLSAADCVEQPFGSCQSDFFGGCSCTYGCTTDDDCGAGMACVCAGVFSQLTQCVPMDCATDSDCGEDLCGLSRYEDICSTNYSLACTSAQDECHSDEECADAPCDPMFPELGDAPHHCTAAGAEGYTCEAPGWCNGDCGRPFFIAGEARTADARARADWCASADEHLLPRVEQLAPQLRSQLAAYWTQVGLFEHASVASFARAAMQLLGLGAPPRLLLATQAAMADEIRHARLTFALASAYAGSAQGPGALAVDDALERRADPATALAGLIDEACVGETLAALEAQHAATLATDPVVANVLERIAADELRHAQLGWRTLRWMLDAHPELRSFALTRLDAALAAARRAGDLDALDQPAPELRAHGVLDSALRAELRCEAISEILAPCVDALRASLAVELAPLFPSGPSC